ncbi:phage shock protein C (PspC) family protein [Sediminihabitans luteus]|uniref:Phage shock protein C (PspC) family protein n=1 Tax=Sediminihabitans luteus TaxID=1138585 RepID=A0A2M9CZB4_9CELL|nr:phage shock protein C (PspC) family protein [Sediminihabitans luteus]
MPPPPSSDPMARFFDSLRRSGLSRSEDRWVGGVAGGLADRFGLDPLLVRGLLFVSFFLSGAGLVLYGIAWALLPEARDGRIHLEQTIRGDVDVALVGAAATVVVGLTWGDGWWSLTNRVGLGWLNGLFWLAAVGVVVYLVVRSRQLAGPAPDTWGGPKAPPAGGDPAWGTEAPAGTWTPPAAQAPAGTADAHARKHDEISHARAEAHRARTDAHKARAEARTEAARLRSEAQRRQHEEAKARRARSAGSSTVVATLGLVLLLGAVVLLLDRTSGAGDAPLLVWLGASIVLVGAVTVVTGLRGRRSGGLTGIAWVLLVAFVPAVAWSALGVAEGYRTVVADGGIDTRPTTVAEAEDGVSFLVGDATIDLTALDLPADAASDPVEIDASFGAGQLTVRVPDGVPVTAHVDIWAGETTWRDEDGGVTSWAGINPGAGTLSSDEVAAGEDPRIVLDITGRTGAVRIVEEQS